jgi:hypothetical protein
MDAGMVEAEKAAFGGASSLIFAPIIRIPNPGRFGARVFGVEVQRLQGFGFW